MSSKLGATLAIVFGWVMAVAIYLFLRTFNDTMILWLWFLVVIAFLPRETYKLYKLWTQNDEE